MSSQGGKSRMFKQSANVKSSISTQCAKCRVEALGLECLNKVQNVETNH